MSKICVLGGGVIGLATAMMLQRDGHHVTVFERDPAPVPDAPGKAWATWARQGVAQFHQPHYLHSAARELLDARLPEVKTALLDSGCVTFDLLSLMPPTISDRSPRPADERFITVTGRRPTIEYAFAQAAQSHVEVTRGATVVGLLTGASAAKGIPHVTGVRLSDGRTVAADLVIDATGRRSKLPDWLEAIGARRPVEEAEESGFAYYTRYFRSDGSVPGYRSGFQTPFHSFSLLTLPGDSNTWSVTVFIYSGDQALKSLREPDRWRSLVAACPLQAHWLEGEPITDVLAMGGITDRLLRLVVDGAPVATGVVTVGDSCACTNPVGGRGITMGLMHAAGTVDVVGGHLDDPVQLALAHHEMTETRLTPWFRHTVAYDRARTAELRAAVAGGTVPPSTDPGEALATAMRYDPDLFRASLEMTSLLTLPDEMLARPAVARRIEEVMRDRVAVVPPGPTRAELLALLN